MVDIYNPTGTPALSDFEFKSGSDPDPNNWPTAPAPTFTVRTSDGGGGADRVTFVWPDGAITNEWVEVTVLANANTGLAENDVFYFANVIGDSDGDGEVGDGDYEMLVGEFGRLGSNLATDFNGDARVDLGDFAIMRAGFGDSVSAPTIPAAAPTYQVVSQLLGEHYENDNSIALLVSASAIDLLPSLALPARYAFGAKPLSVDSPDPMHQRAATGEYDLRPLSDDPGDDVKAGELLADILAESALAAGLPA